MEQGQCQWISIVRNNMKDITEKVTTEQVPLCPICDQPIHPYHKVALAMRKEEFDGGVVCAVHQNCVEECNDLPPQSGLHLS